MTDTNQVAPLESRPLDAAQRMVVELPTGEAIQVIVAEVDQDLEGQHQLRIDGPLGVGDWTSLSYGPVAITVGLAGDAEDEVTAAAVVKRLMLQIREFWSLASRFRVGWASSDGDGGLEIWGRWRSLRELPEAQMAMAGRIDDPSWLLKLRCTWWLAKDAVDEMVGEGEVV